MRRTSRGGQCRCAGSANKLRREEFHPRLRLRGRGTAVRKSVEPEEKAALRPGALLVETDSPGLPTRDDLLAAKPELDLSRILRKLDHLEVLLLADLGYLKRRVDEAEVLFMLITERYERRSLILTSNLGFSQHGG